MVDKLYDLLPGVAIHLLVLGVSHLVPGLDMLPQTGQGYDLVTRAAEGLAGFGGVIAEQFRGFHALIEQCAFCLIIYIGHTSLMIGHLHLSIDSHAGTTHLARSTAKVGMMSILSGW